MLFAYEIRDLFHGGALFHRKINRGTAFPSSLYVCPAQICLRIRAVWSESLQGTMWVAKDLKVPAPEQRGLINLRGNADARLSYKDALEEPVSQNIAY